LCCGCGCGTLFDIGDGEHWNNLSLTGRELLAVDYENSAVGECTSVPTASSDTATATVDPSTQSAAVLRFRSCRWRKAPEDGEAECCVHRDVLPLAGTRGFDPEAWCPDCAFFKLRRTPRRNH
jgi:hypothetical protein